MLDFREALVPVHGRASLSVHFTGTHHDDMAGFYRSAYTENGEKKCARAHPPPARTPELSPAQVHGGDAV